MQITPTLASVADALDALFPPEIAGDCAIDLVAELQEVAEMTSSWDAACRTLARYADHSDASMTDPYGVLAVALLRLVKPLATTRLDAFALLIGLGVPKGLIKDAMKEAA